MTHRQRVDALTAAFLHHLRSGEQESLLDDGGEQVSRAFAVFAAGRGVPVRIVHAEDGDPQRPRHVWVRVLNREGIHGYDVDFATRRFDDPELPCPLVWRMDGQHPVTGVHRTLRVTPAVAPDPRG